MLIIVPTPIGNLKDITLRALEVLQEADLILAEDTRTSGVLLNHYNIQKPISPYHQHNEHKIVQHLVDQLKEGKKMALLTDAGTPGISDPGSRLVRAAIDASHKVSAIPGPTALIMALIISGLPTDRFIFDGFIVRSGQERSAHINELARQRRTVILYEAPHRLHRTLVDLSVACGPERQVALCRELTKIHEEVWRGTLGEAVDHYGTNEPQGEFVLVLHGAPDAPQPTADDIDRLLLAELASGASTKDASTAVSHILGVPKKNAYNRAVELTNSRKITD